MVRECEGTQSSSIQMNFDATKQALGTAIFWKSGRLLLSLVTQRVIFSVLDLASHAPSKEHRAGGWAAPRCLQELPAAPARAGTQQPRGRWPFIPQRAEGPETLLSFPLCLAQTEPTTWHVNSRSNTALHQPTC